MDNKYKKIKNKKIKFWQNKLRELGYKLTEPRRAVLNVLSNNPKLLTVDEIYIIVRKHYPDIAISTVYRTLELLNKSKLICKIHLGIDKSYFLLSENCAKDTSIFMVCDNCGRIIINNDCLNNAIKIRLIDDAEHNIFKNCRLKINKFQISFSGICDKCIENEVELS
jgi:Fur family ferric uptake transcriptional regulator